MSHSWLFSRLWPLRPILDLSVDPIPPISGMVGKFSAPTVPDKFHFWYRDMADWFNRASFAVGR
jgi:hypothetical protein